MPSSFKKVVIAVPIPVPIKASTEFISKSTNVTIMLVPSNLTSTLSLAFCPLTIPYALSTNALTSTFSSSTISIVNSLEFAVS